MSLYSQLKELAADLKIKGDVFTFYLKEELGIIAFLFYIALIVTSTVSKEALEGITSQMLNLVAPIFFGVLFTMILTFITRPSYEAEALTRTAFKKAQEKNANVSRVINEIHEKIQTLETLLLQSAHTDNTISSTLRELSKLFEQAVLRFQDLKIYLKYRAPTVENISSRVFAYIILFVLLYISIGVVKNSPWYYVLSVLVALYAISSLRLIGYMVRAMSSITVQK